MLNNLNIMLLIKNSILFTSFVNTLEQYLGYYANYSLFDLKGSKSKVTKCGILAQVCVSVRLF